MIHINKIKIISFLIILFVVFFFVYYYDFNVQQIFENLEESAKDEPVLSALIFIFVFTVIKFTFIPMSSISIVAGYIFGAFWGVVVSVLAITTGSSLMFFLARLLGQSFVSKIISQKFTKLEKYNKKLEESGFLTVLFFRVVPLFPLGVINFGLGISQVKYSAFFWATIIGSLPGMILLVKAGEFLTDWDNPKLYFYFSLYIFYIGATFASAYLLKKKK